MKNKVTFFIISALIVIAIGAWIWSPGGPLNLNNPEDIANVAVEFHGMIFDVILFGIILTIYEMITEKRRSIKDYRGQLESFKGWYDNEAAFRVRYVVNELGKLGENDLDFSNLHLGKLKKEIVEAQASKGIHIPCLQGANLEEVDLKNANMDKTNLQGIILKKANLKGAHMWGANLQYSTLWGANLQNAQLWEANLKGSYLHEANLQDSDLKNTNLEKTSLDYTNLKGANLERANLEEARLYQANLEGANLKEANLRGAIAYQSQKEAFSQVMTEEQINSMEWYDPNEVNTE